MTPRALVWGLGVGARLHAPLLEAAGFDISLSRQWQAGFWDLVVVALPPFVHRDAIASARPNCRLLLVEKPCCASYEECEVLERDGVELFVNYQLRFLPEAEALRSKIRAGEPIEAVEYASPAWLRSDRPTWATSEALGGGTKYVVTCHLADLLLSVGVELEWIEPTHGSFGIQHYRAHTRQAGSLSIQINLISPECVFRVRGRGWSISFLAPESDHGLSTSVPGPWRRGYARMARALRDGTTGELPRIHDALRVHRVLQSADPRGDERPS